MARERRRSSIIELRSDTFTLPTPDMLLAIARARLGDDAYGEDPTTVQLEQLAANKFGKEAACLMPSGTMANLASILTYCSRGSKILVGDEADVFVYEAGGASACGGVVFGPIQTQPDGRLQLNDLEQAFPTDARDPQFALPALICLENTHNRCGGAALPLSYLQQVHQLAHSRGVPLHLDGARIFNAAIALGVSPTEIGKHADSVQLCLSKGLGAPIGSVVTGNRTFIDGVRRVRKMLGGGMRQTGIIAAAGIIALEHMIDRLIEDHLNAFRLATGLSCIPGIQIDLTMVQTNIVLFRVVDKRFIWQTFIQSAWRQGLHLSDAGHGRIRAVLHYGVTIQDVDAALDIIDGLVRRGPDTEVLTMSHPAPVVKP